MNRKRNVNYIKPEDPEFLKELKRQAGYDDRNHKFDELKNADEDFVDDEESELPQIVVLKKGDLTAEEAEMEKKRLEKVESETKADLSQKVIFKSKQKATTSESKKRKLDISKSSKNHSKKSYQLLSFNDDDEEDET